VETVKPDTRTHAIPVRCGKRHNDGPPCRRRWLTVYATPITGETLIIVGNQGWRNGRWHGPRYEAEPGFTQDGYVQFGDAKWNVYCTRRCGAAHSVKKSILEQLALGAAVQGQTDIWLVDLTRG
jgi:hypothetical protein